MSRSPLAYGPHWFAWVMGTGIIAVALVSLPLTLPGATTVALLFWLLAAGLLAGLGVVTIRQWQRDPGLARRQLDDPALGHFYGAPAMALMTVGTGTLLVGHELIGMPAAVALDAVLWTAGTGLGLVTAVLVPYRSIVRSGGAPAGSDAATGAWLMPVVPPMVSAATGPLLLPHLPAGEARETLLFVCLACFGLTLIAGVLMTATLWQRLLRHGLGEAGSAPAVWIVLGFLGQSVTAGYQLGRAAPAVWPEFGHSFEAFTVLYGVPVWGFAMLWLALATALVVRTARRGMPFTLTWWSFTFPLGTVVTGTSGLAAVTGLHLLSALALVLMAALIGLWSLVAVRTAVRIPPIPRMRSAGLEDWRQAVGDGEL